MVIVKLDDTRSGAHARAEALEYLQSSRHRNLIVVVISVIEEFIVHLFLKARSHCHQLN